MSRDYVQGWRGLARSLGNGLAAADWRRETLYPLTAAMEVAWFTPWYMALIPATGRLPASRTAIGLFLVMVLPVYGSRALARLNLKPWVAHLALALLLLVTCFLALRVFLYAGRPYDGFDWLSTAVKDVLNIYEILPDWLVILLSTLYLSWRGLRLAQRRPSVRSVTFGFYVGILSFILFVLLVSLVTREDPAFFIPAFFFFSLMALAATRMAQFRGLRGAIRSPFGFSWLSAIALAALAVVLLAALLGALLTGGDMAALLRWLTPLLLLGGLGLGLLLWAARALLDLVLGLLGALGLQGGTEPLADLLDGLDELVPSGPDATLEAPAAVGTTLGLLRLALILGLLLGLVVLLVWMARQVRFGREEKDGEGEHASLFSTDLLLAELRGLARAGRGRLASVLDLARRSGVRGLFAALTIRRIYAHMQRLAAEQGYPRAPSQTPYEYERTARRAFPGGAEEIHTITAAYVAVHYGEVPETEAELAQIRACWERLKGAADTSDPQEFSI
jgi:hypothetical protein